MDRYVGKVIIGLGVLILTYLSVLQGVSAQAGGTPVECGSILEAEITEDSPRHTYLIELSAGDTLRVEAQPIGNHLRTIVQLIDPSSRTIEDGFVEIDTIVSANGMHNIEIHTQYGIGAYTLYIGCTKRDGTVINPGDLPPDVQPTLQSVEGSTGGPSETSSVPTFSGVGFPGLAPVDFTNVDRVPLPVGTAMGDVISPSGGEIVGFTLDASADDTLDLTFTRLSGNLNLGLVILSADNQVVFQASLVTSQTLTTRLTLPSDGQYTIGIFRIDLLPPAAPEATAFQLQATLNP